MAKNHGLRHDGDRVFSTQEVAQKHGLGLRMVQRLSARLGFRSYGRAFLLTEADIETLLEWRREHPPGRMPIK